MITVTTRNTITATGQTSGLTVVAQDDATVIVASPTPTPTATPTPTPTPTSTVLAATSRPRITLPPTDLSGSGESGGSDGLPLILMVLIGLAAFAPIVARANWKSSRR